MSTPGSLAKNFETVYRILTPFQRNTPSLNEFNNFYKTYKQQLNANLREDITGLQADMEQYLGGDSLKFSLFLLGDDAWATKEIHRSEAERLSQMALQLTFERDDGVRVPIPHETAEVASSECLYRAMS